MNSKRGFNAEIIRSLFGDENGAILVVVLIFVGILALVGATATIITTTDTKIGANYKASGKALYEAEAGAQEARQRLRGATPSIPDDDTGNALWKTYIKTDIGAIENCKAKGYDENDTNHHIVDSLQTGMDYTVVITHQTDDQTVDGNVFYLGDSSDGDGDFKPHTDPTRGDPNIYLITSYGTAEGSTKTVQLEVAKVPPLAPTTIKGALYSGASTSIRGNVKIYGHDSCLTSNKSGIAMQKDWVDAENPLWVAQPANITGVPSVEYGVGLVKVQAMADFFKKSADFSYSLDAFESHDSAESPGPGDGWGTPDFTASPPCSSCNIVYYNTDNIIELKGVTGCGILVVDGNLDIKNGFAWYGTIIVTKAFSFAGGSGNDIRGAVISKGLADGDDDYTGSGQLKYCSTAIDLTNCHALITLSWKEVLSE